MLVRCMHCYTPFTLSQEGILAALDEVEAKGYKHYNAFCPRCGRPNMVAKAQLEREVPEWAPRVAAMQPVTSPPEGVSSGQAQAAARPAPAQPKPAASAAKSAAKPAAKKATKKAAPKKTAAKKPAAKKPAAKKAAAKKPAAKKTAAKAKAKPKAKTKKKPAAKKKK